METVSCCQEGRRVSGRVYHKQVSLVAYKVELMQVHELVLALCTGWRWNLYQEQYLKKHIKLLGASSDSILGNRIKGFGGLTSNRTDEVTQFSFQFWINLWKSHLVSIKDSGNLDIRKSDYIWLLSLSMFSPPPHWETTWGWNPSQQKFKRTFPLEAYFKKRKKGQWLMFLVWQAPCLLDFCISKEAYWGLDVASCIVYMHGNFFAIHAYAWDKHHHKTDLQ